EGVDILSSICAWGEVARGNNNMGEVYKDHGDLEKAVDCYNRSKEMAERGKDRRTRGYALGNAAECYARMGNVEKAKEMTLEAERYFIEVGEEYVVASIKMIWGIIAAKEKKWEEAEARFEEGAATLELLGIRYDLALLLIEHGAMLMEKGDPEKASEILDKALACAIDMKATALQTIIEGKMRTLEEDG
ncbi:MAG: tetratricopeptide repeat protein, partial [Thermoplasmata archaeon]|nr:tetratricopeptide repeat protein [Thermoplasmata archaeon]